MEIVEGHLKISPPKGVPVWDIDPYHPAILTNPMPYYAELRSKGAFAYIPKYSMLACGRYAETKEVFSDWQRFVSSRGVGLDDFKYTTPWRPPSLVLEVDPPYHSMSKKILMRALAPKPVAQLTEQFRFFAEVLIDALIAKGAFDAVSDFAEIFPTTIFPAAVGMQDPNRRYLLDYGAMVFNSMGPNNDLRNKSLARVPALAQWINTACGRDKLEANGFGAVIYAAADNGEISEDEASKLVRSFLSAGLDTTVSSIGNALWCLIQFPDAFEALKAEPRLARPCFEEVLRYTSPVHSFCRTANEDTEVVGIELKEGTKILCVLGSANLDETHWKDPHIFDIKRLTWGHLAFGVGIHSCVGQVLARAEMEAVLTAIAQKVKRIELIEKPVWRPNNAMHALERMMIRFHGH